MLEAEFQVPVSLAYLATFLWALSGAIVGMHKGYDITGVFVVTLLSSTGDGLLRDGLFLQRTPQMLVSAWYIMIILAATAVVALFRQGITQMTLVDQLVGVIDALGVSAFAAVGMQLALQANLAHTEHPLQLAVAFSARQFTARGVVVTAASRLSVNDR